MIDNSARLVQMREMLEAAFSPTVLEIEDQSHLHVGHAGAATGKGHFEVRICAAALDGLPLIQQHRKIYEALGDMMQTDIHALSIKVQRAA